jgi:hypothetical protein
VKALAALLLVACGGPPSVIDAREPAPVAHDAAPEAEAAPTLGGHSEPDASESADGGQDSEAAAAPAHQPPSADSGAPSSACEYAIDGIVYECSYGPGWDNVCGKGSFSGYAPVAACPATDITGCCGTASSYVCIYNPDGYTYAGLTSWCESDPSDSWTMGLP